MDLCLLEQYMIEFIYLCTKCRNMKSKTNWIFFGCMILMSMALRMFQHPFNFTSVLSLTLLGSAFISRKTLAWLIPFALMWLTDLVLNNTIYASYFDGFSFFSNDLLFTGLAFGLIVLAGSKLLKRINIGTILGSAVVASLLFYLISNVGVWMQGFMYPKTAAGLVTCLEAGLPFFRNSLIGTCLFSLISFNAYTWFTSKQFMGLRTIQA